MSNALADLRIFTKVVKAGSFSAAARQLGLPPSSVSRRIGALEQRLGVPLFVRTTRQVSLTEAGRVYSTSVQRVLSDLEDADQIVSQFHDRPRGTLCIESRVSLGSRLIAPLLPRFIEEHPGLSIDLRLTSQRFEGLSQGVDLGIRFGLGKASSLMTRKVASTRQGIYASPKYLARHGEPRTPDDLLNHNCLAFVIHDEMATWRFRGVNYSRELRIAGNYRSNDTTALHAVTVDGLGIGVYHHWVVKQDVEEGRLVRILSDYDVTTMPTFDTHIYVVYPPNMQNLPKIRGFIDFLVRALAEITQLEPASRIRDS
jgi:DNA-binding transcriptional LysR family regulator